MNAGAAGSVPGVWAKAKMFTSARGGKTGLCSEVLLPATRPASEALSSPSPAGRLCPQGCPQAGGWAHWTWGCAGRPADGAPPPQICHSKSGEINPVKVGNLVRAYVDKYRHMRRHRRPEAGEEPPAQGAEG